MFPPAPNLMIDNALCLALNRPGEGGIITAEERVGHRHMTTTPDLRQPVVEAQRRASHDMNNSMPQIAVSAPLRLASFRPAPDDGDYDMALVTIEGGIVLMSSMRYAEKRSGSSMIVP